MSPGSIQPSRPCSSARVSLEMLLLHWVGGGWGGVLAPWQAERGGGPGVCLRPEQGGCRVAGGGVP